MTGLESLTLVSDTEERQLEPNVQKKESSGSSNRPTPSSKSLLSLPNEILSSIVGHLESRGPRICLQLSAKRFYPVCKPWIWRQVYVSGDFDDHDLMMYHLVSASLAPLVRSVVYSLTSPVSRMSALLLSTHFTAITHLALRPHPNEDDEDEDKERNVLPKTMTRALKALGALRSLDLHDLQEIEDPAFSLSGELPQLTSLCATSLNISESLFKNGPTLRSLEIRLNDFGCTAIVACAQTLHSLILHRDEDEEQGSLSENKRLNQLRLLFDSMCNKHHTLPLQSLTLESFELLETRDTTVRPHPRLMEFLSALRGTLLSTLRIKGFCKVKCSANDDPGFGVFLPGIKNLQLSVGGYQQHSPLDSDSILFLRSLLRCFPNTARLTLDRWLIALDPRKLATLELLELGIYSPIFYLLLEPLRRTELSEVRLEGGWYSWGSYVVRLLREDDGFRRELLRSE